MNALKYLFQKFLSFLRVRSVAGGLEVSDEVLRLVIFDGKNWKMGAIRLEPGVMERGVLKNEEALSASLRALREKIMGAAAKSKKKMNVVVALSSAPIYSQSFTLPLMEGEELAKAIDLNVQMLSPVEASRVYAGASILGRDEEKLKLELSAAFIDKTIVDAITKTLYDSGFMAVGLESRPLSITRVLREKGSGVGADKSYLVVNIDNSGLEFLIVRKGELYFEYANQWTELADDKGAISVTKFNETLAASMRQVLNFHEKHWAEPLSGVILSAAAFRDEAEATIRVATPLPVIRLTLLMGQAVSSEWLVALGVSLRGSSSASSKVPEIDLLGDVAAEAFRRDQLTHFLELWRILVPVALGILLITFGLADGFLINTQKSIESQSSFSLGSQPSATAALTASSTEFNNLVALAQSVESAQSPKYGIISEILAQAASSSVQVAHITFQGAGQPISLAGTAKAEEKIPFFKAAIEADPHFGPVSLPLSSIQLSNDVYTFSMTFPLSSSAFQ